MANKPWKPRKTMKTLDFVCPWKNTLETLKLHPTPEKLCSEANFSCINFWPCSAVAFFISVMQGRRIYEVIGGGGKNSVSFVMWQAASFSINGHKISSKRQNERWMGTEDLNLIIIFSENIVKRTLEKPLKFGRKPPGKPWKRISLHCLPP